MPCRPLLLLSQKVAVSAPVESVFVEIHIGLGAEMNHRRTDDSESRFAGYVEGLASVIGHKDREEPLRQAGSPAQAGQSQIRPLDDTHVGVTLQEIRCESVPQRMRRDPG